MWRGGEKESYTTQQDSRGKFVEGRGRDGKSDRRDLWNGSGGKERETQEGSAFYKGLRCVRTGLDDVFYQDP